MPQTQNKMFKLQIRSSPKEIVKVEPFLKKVNCTAHFNKTQFHNMLIATTEAVNNSIIHGNQRDPKKFVNIICIVNPKYIEIHVIDEGKGVRKKDIPDPLKVDNILREFGRGIFIMQHFMDSVKFRKLQHGGEVIMRLKKRSVSRSSKFIN